MERVQYQLERSLPQLQLLDQHEVFTKAQLNAITAKRQTFEAQLQHRPPIQTDFLRYAEYEQQLASLINLKAKRAALPRAFTHANSAAHSAHILSIYERLVRKFKYSPDAWNAYIQYAKGKKMRVGRVYARALALLTDNVPLWLSAADHELAASPSAARALLQQALRLNAIPSTQATTSLKLSPREAHLLRLWVEYVRMELVFIERLRKRRAVLDPDTSAAPTLNGDIPVLLISSGLQTLPASLHFLYVASLSELFRTFPFADAKLRDRLTTALFDVEHIWPEHCQTPLALLAATQRWSAPHTEPDDDQFITANRLRTNHSEITDGLLQVAQDAVQDTVKTTANQQPELNQFVLQMLESRLTHNGNPTQLYHHLADTGAIPGLVRDSIAELRPTHPQAAALLIQFLADSSRSGITEPHMLKYLQHALKQVH